MASTIVVPLDRSPVAESALPFAVALARSLGARMTLLAVIDLPFEFAAWLDATTVIDARIDVEDAYEDYLEVTASEIDDVPVETVVRVGGATSEIQQYVESVDEPIIVMASHGRSGVRRMLVGSVTQQVVHRIQTPVIVVPARIADDQVEHVGEIESVLVPLDGSEFAEYALEAGLEVLGDRKPHIHLLRVVEVVSWYGGPYSGMDYYGLDPYIDVSRDAATKYLNTVSERLEDRGYRVSSEVRVGLVADQVEAVAESREVDLMIMATHGRTGVGRLIFGSVAERTLRQSPVPLMLVHPGPGVSDVPVDLSDSMLTIQS
jgi:nucleotide-binding universal stress UspA family protein